MKTALRTLFLIGVPSSVASAAPMPIETSAWVTFAQNGFASITVNQINLGTAPLAGSVATASSNQFFDFAEGDILRFSWIATSGSGLILSLPGALTALQNCIPNYGCGVFFLSLLPANFQVSASEFEARSRENQYEVIFKNSYYGRIGFAVGPSAGVTIRDLTYGRASLVSTPATLPLVVLGLGMLIAANRRTTGHFAVGKLSSR